MNRWVLLWLGFAVIDLVYDCRHPETWGMFIVALELGIAVTAWKEKS